MLRRRQLMVDNRGDKLQSAANSDTLRFELACASSCRGSSRQPTCRAEVGSLMVAGRVMRVRSLPIAFLRTDQMLKPREAGCGAGSRTLAAASAQGLSCKLTTLLDIQLIHIT